MLFDKDTHNFNQFIEMLIEILLVFVKYLFFVVEQYKRSGQQGYFIAFLGGIGGKRLS